MSELDNRIQRLAQEFDLQEFAGRQREAAFEARIIADRPGSSYPIQETWDAQARQNRELIDRFADWADHHDIDYNSPSLLARGWCVGVRGIALSSFRRGTSDGNIQDELSGPVPIIVGHEYSLRSLIVKRSKRINEIRVVSSIEEIPDEPEPDLASRFQVPMSVANTLGRYPPMTIVRSIARLSSKYGVRWDG